MDIIVESGDAFDLESVQQSHFGSRFVFWHFNLQIEMQIGAQMRRTVILHSKPILSTSKLKIEMEIQMKWYIFLSVPIVAVNFNTAMQIEMKDCWTLSRSDDVAQVADVPLGSVGHSVVIVVGVEVTSGRHTAV